MKIAVIGGGGVRSPLLARSIAHKSKDIHIDEVIFMDNDREKLNIYGKISQKISQKINPKLVFEITDSFEKAVKDANYIITTIRVGNDEMRVTDERTSLAYGVIGQETTGASAISFAMRSVSVLSEYCEIIKKMSHKNVKMFNFTNPAGIVTQTLRDIGYDFCYGICDAPTSLIDSIAKIGQYQRDKLSFECIGLNHFSFITSVQYNNNEVIDEILSNSKFHDSTDLKFIDQKLMQDKKLLFNEYLYYYLYPREAFKNISQSKQIRSEMIRDINEAMKQELETINIDEQLDKALLIYSKWINKREESYMKNETGMFHNKEPFVFDISDDSKNGYASIALDYIDAVENDLEKDIVLCTQSNKNLGFNNRDIIEVTCTVTKNDVKVHDISIEDDLILELIKRMKQYERSASKALRSHKKSDFIACLMLNPLVSSYSLAVQLTNQFFEINKNYYKEK